MTWKDDNGKLSELSFGIGRISWEGFGGCSRCPEEDSWVEWRLECSWEKLGCWSCRFVEEARKVKKGNMKRERGVGEALRKVEV